MVEYVCDRCKKIYNHKGEYARHIARKIPCKIATKSDNAPKIQEISVKLAKISKAPQNSAKNCEIYTCQFCEKQLSDKYGVQRHLKICKTKKQQEQQEEDKFQIMINMMNELKKVTTDQMNQIEELKKEISTSNTKSNVVNNIINNQQNNINMNIHVNPYNDTDMNFLSVEDKKYILNKGYKAVENLIKMIHFNKDKPENHNIYISNIKDKYVLIYGGDDLMRQESDKIIDDMYDERTKYLLDEFNSLKNELDAPTKKKFENFINEMDEDKISNDIKKEIIMILYNNRKIIEETRKLIKVNSDKVNKIDDS